MLFLKVKRKLNMCQSILNKSVKIAFIETVFKIFNKEKKFEPRL